MSEVVDLKVFTDPRLAPSSMDIFVIRRSLLGAVKQASSLFSGTVLDLGCGCMPYKEIVTSSGRIKGYIGLDLWRSDLYQCKPDLVWDGKTIPLSENSVDCAMATEVFEHCPEPEMVMREILRVLRPGGLLFFTVPFLWPLHDVPYDQYRYTPFSLERHLKNAGFTEINLKSMGGWDAGMAQMIGLYARRRPMSGYKRFFFSMLAFPLFYLLSRLAQKRNQSQRLSEAQEDDFQGGSMITGIWGVAFKPDIPIS